jgi:hypothetical protein
MAALKKVELNRRACTIRVPLRNEPY